MKRVCKTFCMDTADRFSCRLMKYDLIRKKARGSFHCCSGHFLDLFSCANIFEFCFVGCFKIPQKSHDTKTVRSGIETSKLLQIGGGLSFGKHKIRSGSVLFAFGIIISSILSTFTITKWKVSQLSD